MQLLCGISMRMATTVLILLFFMQLPRTLASDLHSKDYGPCHISYSSDSGQDLLYINGKLVDRDLFCEVLKFYHTNHCFLSTNIRNHICVLDGSTDEFPLRTRRKFLHPVVGRKFLHPVVGENSIGQRFGKRSQASKDKNAVKPLFNKKLLAMAVPGFFILCGCLLCPCFRAQKKESTHTTLARDQNSMDSVSSMEMNSVSDRILASPRVPPSPSRFLMSPKLTRVGSVHLSMSQIAKATHNFSSSLKIGEGGFGTVYKAKLEDGHVVAIKRAKKEHFEALRTEFSTEVELLSKIDHRNLVKLLGYVDKGNERLLITEYVPNGTLREHLDVQQGKVLDFNQRLEISIDVAHGLTYLHLYSEKQIIHRDVKSSNILLTESMRAKVADFGFARLGDMDSDKTHISTKVKGTIGYLDPEYMKTYKLTPKSDVYSFGILLLEILTGRRPVELKRSPDERITLRWAFRNYRDRNVAKMLDPSMLEPVDNEILMKMFGLAFQCAAPTRADRPEMKMVGEQLWTIRMDYLSRGRGH